MSVMGFLKAAVRNALPALGSRKVRLDGDEVDALIDTLNEGQGLEFGGDLAETDIVAIIPREQLARLPQIDDECEVDGMTYRITRVEGGEAAVTVVLQEGGRE